MINQELAIELFTRIGGAAVSLFSQALGRKVQISAPTVSVAAKSEAAMASDQPCAIACMPVDSPRPGVLLYALTPPLDTLIPELVINPHAAAPPKQFTELHKGAFAELMNRFQTSAAPILSHYLGAEVRGQAPVVIHMTLRECLRKMPLFTGIDSFVLATWQLRIQDVAAANILLILPASFLAELMLHSEQAHHHAEDHGGILREIPLEHIASPAAKTEQAKPITRQRKKSGRQDVSRNLNALLDVPVEVIAELGKADMDVKDILSLAPGRVVELDQSSSAPINILVNGKLIARGEIVVVGENFGLKVTRIVSPSERL